MDSKLDSAESEGDTVLLENTDEAGNSGNESDTVLVEKLSSDEIQTISEVAASIQPPEKQQQKQPPEPEPLSSSENANQGNEAKSQRTEESAADIYDVIVIGAGIAGSSAAYLLKKKRASLRVLVLEAKDRVGGRTQSLDLKCSADGQRSRWDVGGQWVTDTQKNITKLLAELGIETYRQFDVGKKILETNRKLAIYNSAIPKISLLGLVDLQLMMMKITSSARKISTLHPFKDSSLARHLDLSNLDQFLGSRSFSASSRSILDPTIRTIFGCEMTQLNTLFGLMYVKSGGGSIENLALTSEGCAQEKRVKGGAQQISERLLAAASVGCEAETGLLLNWALVEVNQSVAAATAEDIGSVVVLTARNTKTGDLRQFKARKVISSMPLNQYVHVGFEPELPAHKRHVFQFCQMGNLIKFIVTYEEAFWRNKGFSGEVVSDGSCLWLNEERAKAMGRETRERLPSIGPIACIFDGTNSEGFPALVGFIGGRCAVEWTGKPIIVSISKLGLSCRDMCPALPQ